MRRRTSGNKNNQQPTRSSREERRTSVERTNRSRVRPHRLAWPTLRLFLVPPHDRTPPTATRRPRTNVPTTTTKEVCHCRWKCGMPTHSRRSRKGIANDTPTTKSFSLAQGEEASRRWSIVDDAVLLFLPLSPLPDPSGHLGLCQAVHDGPVEEIGRGVSANGG